MSTAPVLQWRSLQLWYLDSMCGLASLPGRLVSRLISEKSERFNARKRLHVCSISPARCSQISSACIYLSAGFVRVRARHPPRTGVAAPVGGHPVWLHPRNGGKKHVPEAHSRGRKWQLQKVEHAHNDDEKVVQQTWRIVRVRLVPGPSLTQIICVANLQ